MPVAGPGLGVYGDVWNPNTKQINNNSGPVQGPGLGIHGDVWNPISQQVNNQPSGGGGGGSVGALPGGPTGYSGANQGDINRAYQAFMDAQNSFKNDISTGWDSYIGTLGDTLNKGLPDQRTAQEGIVNSQYEQGSNTINAQKTKSLRDISGNIRNAFQAGNTYLGSAGAGDSSAANQYSFALQKESAKQTSNLNEFVNTQLQTLGKQRDQSIQQIASWFADSQNQIRQAIASGQLSKSQDLANISKSLLDQGNSMLNQINQNAQSRYNALVGWAASNSQNIGQLQQNIAGIPKEIGTPTVDSGGNFRVPTGYGGSSNEQSKSLFNPQF